MPLRRSVVIGAAKLEVSPLCVGMVNDPDTVIAAWDAGINFFFLTADMHWPLYEGLRQGLKRLAKARPAALDEAVIACTAYVAQPEFLKVPYQEALDSIAPFQKLDLLIAGGSYTPDVAPRLKVLKGNVDSKWVNAKAIGMSAHDRAAAVTVINDDSADLVFVRYNAQHPGARFDLFPHLKPARTTRIFNFKSTYGYQPAAEFHKMGVDPELWFPARTDYYRFVMCRPELDGILCAPTTPAEVEGAVAAYELGPLPQDEEEHLLALAKLRLDAAMKEVHSG